MNVIYEDDTVRIFYEKGEGNNTLVCCSGIDFDVFGFDSTHTYTPETASKPEFVKVTTGMGDRFWIIDKNRSWGCHIDWQSVANFLGPYFEGRNVVALGNCMGATNAIKFAYHADVHRVIAFTPHWSVDPNEVTHEFDPRSKVLRERALSTGWKSLEGMFRPMTTYVHFWTPTEVDVPHMIKFPTLPNIKRIFLPTASHEVAKMLRDCGVLSDVLSQCIIAEDIHSEVSKILDNAGIIYELF